MGQIQNSILNGKPAILHFSGHGGGGALCFEDCDGDAVLVTSKDFAELIELNKDCIACVVLNACFSEDIAKEVAPHVKCVVGCDDSIADDAAIMFTRSFYRTLANGKSFEESFRFAKNEVSLAGMRNEADKYKITLR